MIPEAAIQGKGLLSPIQKSFLALFSKIPDQNQFYLTGGTALAEYYLGHRLSYDLDFFTSIEELILPVSYQIENLGREQNLDITVVRRFSSYVELLVVSQDERLKIDLALDSPYRFEPPVFSTEGVYVNDYKDLQIDKLLAYFGRAEPRDAVDLFYILKNETIENLILLAAQKDPGFDVYWFIIALNKSSKFPDELNRWPVQVLLPFNPIELKEYFQTLMKRLSDRLRN